MLRAFLPTTSIKVIVGVLLSLILSSASGINADARGRGGNYYSAISHYNAGVQLMAAQRKQEAINAFKLALLADPGFKMAYGPLGQMLYLTGAYSEAVPELKKAVAYDQNNLAIWCQLAVSATKIGEHKLAQEAFQRYLQLDPYGSYAGEARRSLAILNEKLSPESGTAEKADYLHDFRGGARRWQTGGAPLTVYIAPQSTPRDRELVEAAFVEWTQLSDGLLRFQQVNSPEAAQIVCQWTNNPAMLAGSGELGWTRLRYGSKGSIQHASVLLLVNKGAFASEADRDRRSYLVALHEIGHALGLQHSHHPADVMSPTVAPSGLEFGPTARDRNTVLSLYRG